MNALTYGDYFGIAIFTIGLYLVGQVIYAFIAVIIGVLLKGKKDPPQLPSVYYLLESSYNQEVTMSEVEKELQLDIEQGLITSYTIGEGFIVYSLRDGQKRLIDLSRYDVE